MKALRKPQHTKQSLRSTSVKINKLPEEKLISTQEPRCLSLRCSTPGFPSSHIPEFTERAYHSNLKKTSALIPKLQEDKEGRRAAM